MRMPKAPWVAAAGAVLTLVPASGATAAPATRVVAGGLDNPRGPAFGPNGRLYAAEAGRGGAGPCTSWR